MSGSFLEERLRVYIFNMFILHLSAGVVNNEAKKQKQRHLFLCGRPFVVRRGDILPPVFLIFLYFIKFLEKIIRNKIHLTCCGFH